MFELSICVDNINDKIYEKYSHYLHNSIRNNGGIFSCLNLGGSKYFLVASKVNELKVKSICEDSICGIILDGFKADYIKKNLSYHTLDTVKYETLISAMVNFDRNTDNRIILSALKGRRKEINIYSLFKFKLAILIDKWRQLVEIANANSVYLGFDETYLDILKFLVDGIEIGEELRVVKSGDGYTIFDANNNILTYDDLSSDSDMLASIVAHNPIRVTVSGLDENATVFLQSIFEERMRIK